MIDHDYVRSLSNLLLDSGVWIEDFDLAVGAEAKENENIEKVFSRICHHYGICKVGKEEFKDRAIIYYSKKIIEARGDHVEVMRSVYRMVDLIQNDLGYDRHDKKCIGEAAKIEDFIGPYYEYEEYEYYQMSEDQIAKAKDDDITQVTEAANKAVDKLSGSSAFSHSSL